MDKNTRDVLLIAIPLAGTLFTGYVALQQTRLTEKVGVVADKVAVVGTKVEGVTSTIETLEKNTNSIKDALVKSTAENFEAKGKAKEQAAQKSRETDETARRRAVDKAVLDNALKLKGEKK